MSGSVSWFNPHRVQLSDLTHRSRHDTTLDMPQHCSSTDVHFDFALRPHGWADATFEIGEVLVSVLASHMSDALGDLLRAALALAVGAHEQKVVWVEEPGCNKWVFTREFDMLRVEVDHCEGLYPAHQHDARSQGRSVHGRTATEA
jgi:hypothetical protein